MCLQHCIPAEAVTIAVITYASFHSLCCIKNRQFTSVKTGLILEQCAVFEVLSFGLNTGPQSFFFKIVYCSVDETVIIMSIVIMYLDVFGILKSRKTVHVRIAFNEAWITFVQTSIRGWSLSLPIADCDALNLKINCTCYIGLRTHLGVQSHLRKSIKKLRQIQNTTMTELYKPE